MFGGIGFLLHGNMCVGVWHTALIVRLGADEAAKALKESNVVEIDASGRPMKGWAVVEGEDIERDEQLTAWIQQAVEFVETLPRKRVLEPGGNESGFVAKRAEAQKRPRSKRK